MTQGSFSFCAVLIKIAAFPGTLATILGRYSEGERGRPAGGTTRKRSRYASRETAAEANVSFQMVYFGVFEAIQKRYDFACRNFQRKGKVAGTDLLPREAESGKGSLPIFSSTKFTRRNLKRESKETTKGGQKTDA